MRTERAPALLVALFFVAAAVGLVATTTADPDLWGHVRFGQDILASHSIARLDPYSFTSDQPWTNHEWLAETAMAVAYRHGGVPGLLLLPLCAGLVSIAAAAKHLRRAGVGEPVTAVLATVLFVGIQSQLSTVRPQVFSIVCLVALLTTPGSAERGRPGRLLLLLPIFAAWANLHGEWVVGLGVVGLWAAAAVARGVVPWRPAALAPVFAVAGSAVTPYGWRLWSFLWQTVGLTRADIEDWQPLYRHPGHLIPWLLGVLVLVAAWRRRPARSAWAFVPPAVLGLLACAVTRLDVSFVVCSVLMAGPLLAGLGRDRFPLSRPVRRGDVLVVGLLAAVGLSAALALASGTAACLPIEPGGVRPVMPEPEAVAFARRNHLAGSMVSWFDYGEYAIWHLAPDVKVSYDGRRETVYSGRTREAHLRFYRGDAPEFPREIGADYIWLRKDLPASARLPAAGWTPVFRGSRSVIFARRAGAFLPVAPFSGRRCFPGP